VSGEWNDSGEWGHAFEIWEHQGERLTAGALRRALDLVDDDLPLVVAFHDGQRVLDLAPMELGPTGPRGRPDRLVLTVVELP